MASAARPRTRPDSRRENRAFFMGAPWYVGSGAYDRRFDLVVAQAGPGAIHFVDALEGADAHAVDGGAVGFAGLDAHRQAQQDDPGQHGLGFFFRADRKSTRLNSSHV